MGTLTACIKKAGSALHPDDKAAILARARALYRTEGIADTAAAAKQAVDEQIVAVQALIDNVGKTPPPVAAPTPPAPPAPTAAELREQARKAKEAARLAAENQRVAQREIFNALSTSLDMIGKTVDEVVAEIQKRLPEGVTLVGELIQKLAEQIRAKVAANKEALLKAQHRDPAVLADAVWSAYQASILGGPPFPKQQAAFQAGFEHALKGKTKSTMVGEDLATMLKGYQHGREWASSTEEGKAWFEGRPVNKLVNTGLDLRRHWELLQEQLKANQTDAEKAWKAIERATARSDIFAPLMPDGASPGFKLYVMFARDHTYTLKKWIEQHRWSGVESYQGDKSSNIDYIIEGSRYPSTLSKEDRDRFKSDEAYRAAYLQDLARDYLKQVREWTDSFLAGRSSVKEAADKFAEAYLKPKEKQERTYLGKLTDLGRKIISNSDEHKGVVDASYYEFEALGPEHTFTKNLIDNEQTAKLPERADPLSAPKLDRITRTGPDLRKGADITPEQFKKTFGVADVGFGKWVQSKQDQDHLNYAYDAWRDLSKHFGTAPENMGFGGNLHFTIGALGHGRASAHFAPQHPGPEGVVQVINLTNTRGDGTVYHEWIHALDHNLRGEWLSRVRPRLLDILTRGVITPAQVDKRAHDFLFGGWGWSGSRRAREQRDNRVQNAIRAMEPRYMERRVTAFKSNADLLGKAYWGNDHELIARAGEAWGSDTLGFTNDYLVNPAWVGDGMVTKAKGFRGTPYPSGDERALFNQAYTALSKAIKWKGGAPTVTLEDFESNLGDDFTAGTKRMLFLREPANMQAVYDAELAKKEAAEYAEQAAKAKAAQDEAKQLEDLTAAALAAIEPPTIVDAPTVAPTDTLDDADLNALFDEASAELHEAARETPGETMPGGALDEQAADAAADKWSKADLDEMMAEQDRTRAAGVATAMKLPGLPTIHELGAMGETTHMGFGDFQTKGNAPNVDVRTPGKQWIMNWSGGGAMRRTASGKAYTLVFMQTGERPFTMSLQEAMTAVGALESKKTPTTPQAESAEKAEPKAGELITEAAKLGVKGIDEALTGLAKLFGGAGRLNAFGGGFDEETYQKARPHFKAALEAFQAAGKTLKDLFKLLIQMFGDGVKEYAIRFAKDEGLTQTLGTKPTASSQIAEQVRQRLANGQAFDWRQLFEISDAAYGGTQGEGKYTPKDAYDAMEAGVNLYLKQQVYNPNADRETALMAIGALDRVMAMLPTQSKRTAEQDEFQQFSTVPPLAYAAAWASGVKAGDVVMEPSAGIGGLAVFAHNAGARLVLNELSSRRAGVLQEVFPGVKVWQENAEQIDNILPDEIVPNVVLMNPPFSATAGRMEGQRDTQNGARHIKQALERLASGGRLVAIVGEGMAMDKPAFRGWWTDIKAKYDVRAAVPMDGAGYAKYGTTFDNVLLIIDKKAPGGNDPVTTRVESYTDLVALLSEVRNDRPNSRIPANDHSGVELHDAESQRDLVADGGRSTSTDGSGGGTPAGDRGGEGQGRPGVAGAGGGRGPQRGEGRSGGDVQEPRTGRTGDGGDAGRGDQAGAAGGGRSDSARQPTGVKVESGEAVSQALSDSIFEDYLPQRLKVPGAKPHPGALVQSAALGSVLPPEPTYTPNLPKQAIESGKLSIAQIESIVYAGQAHEQMLPGDVRRGFFIGDGTGVGKGREISGIILDNLRNGRKKAVWISEKQGLMTDAQRDFGDIGGDKGLIFNQNKTNIAKDIIEKNGILYTTYHTLKMGAVFAPPEPNATQAMLNKAWPAGSTLLSTGGNTYVLVKWDKKDGRAIVKMDGDRQGKLPFSKIKAVNGDEKWNDALYLLKKNKSSGSRLDQVIRWLGEDFDGVIVFDEAHNANNAIPISGERGSSEPAAKALAVVELQKKLPKARVVYVSATGATEVANLSFATRLGLWGEGTAFPSVESFIAKMTAGGLATMELVTRDMKQMGMYLARSLSFNGVQYSRVDHELSDLQRDIYDRLADAWQVTLQNMNEALAIIGAVDSGGKAKGGSPAKRNMKSAYWGAQQRFFNQIITSMQMPTAIEQMERDLANGDAVVIQLVNTNEAQQERALAARQEEDEEGGGDLEDLDLTPRDQLIQMVEKAFPTAQHEDYTDDSGNKKTRIVVDSNGKPVENKAAVRMKEKLLQDLKDIRVPDGPLEIILNTFGPAKVAEITGRSQRVVRKPNDEGNVVAQLESRTASNVRADADAFMADKKSVLVFSDAGGTGFSFQADLTKPNQRVRRHYLVQPGWRANKALQGLGRTHRSNEKQPPEYKLVSTDIPAHKRFLSSIARRLSQLGALTSGSREAASQGLFSEKDNLESKYATRAAKQLIDDARAGQIDGVKGDEFLRQMGLEDIVNPETLQIAEDKYPPTRQFLNRMLSLRLDMQDKIFNAFIGRMEEQVEIAAQRGELDTGMQTIKALSAEVKRDEVVYTDPRTKAETRYVQLELTHPTRFYPFPEGQMAREGKAAEWVVNIKSGRVWGKILSGTMTKRNGAITDRYRMLGSNGMQVKEKEDFQPAKYGGPQPYKTITVEEARELWAQEEAKRPPTYTDQAHMIVGALLPIWDRMETEGVIEVARTQTTDGRRLLGRVIKEGDLKDVLRRLNVQSAESKMPAAQVMAEILRGKIGELANGWRLERAKVSDDLRVEIRGRELYGAVARQLVAMGAIQERISWQERFFIPTSKEGVETLANLLRDKPLVELISKDKDDADTAALSMAESHSQSMQPAGLPTAADEAAVGQMTTNIINEFGKSFGIQPAEALTDEQRNASDVLLNAFGVRPVFFSTAEPFANGLLDRSQPGVIFLNVAAERPMLAVAGHEMLHRLRQDNPGLYKALADAMESLLQDADIHGDLINLKRQGKGWAPLSKDKLREELLGDIAGDNFLNPEFWTMLAQKLPQGRISELLKALLAFFDRVISKLTGKRGYFSEQYLRDVKEARRLMARAFAQYAETKAAGEGQGIDFEAGRVAASGKAGWTDKRIDDLLNAYGYTMKDDRTKAYVGWVRPSDYLAATTPAGERKRLEDEAGDLRQEDLAGERQPIMLFGEFSAGGFFKLDGHEGRHRMAALARAGVLQVPVVYKLPEGVDAPEARKSVFVPPQRWGKTVAEKGFLTGTLEPISYGNRDTLKAKFGATGGIDFDLRDTVGNFKQQAVRNTFADWIGSGGAKVSWWDKTLGTQFSKALKFPEFGKVFRRVQSYLEGVSTLANEAADHAPGILPKLETWKDLTGKELSKADREALVPPIYQGTLLDERVYSERELTDRFKLTERQKNLYRQYLSAVNTSLDQVLAADVLKLLGDMPPEFARMVQDNRPAFKSAVNLYLNQRIDNTQGAEQARFRDLLGKVNAKYDKVAELKAKGYAPLMRFGKYFVHVKGPATGSTLYFSMHESAHEANQRARDMREDPMFKGMDVTVEQGVLSQEQYKLFSAVPIESMEMFAEALGAENSEVFQEWLKLTKNNRSAMKRLIHRKGTAGFSTDLVRTLASFVTSTARASSASMNLPEAKKLAGAIRDGDVKDEAIKLIESVQDPADNAAAIRGLMFMNFIGGSIASAAVNLTQPLTMTLPFLSQFGGITKAASRLIAAAKAAATGRTGDKDLQDALDRAERDGIVSPQEIHHLTNEAMATWGTNPVAKRLAFIWASPFSLAEQFNRRITFIAAYQTAKAQNIEDPFKFAERAVVETQGLYNRGNMPNLSRSALGAAALTFKQFSIHYLEWLKRMWNTGAPGSQERKDARRAVLYALGLLALAGGTDGLPFAEDLDDLVDTISQALGFNLSSKKAKREFVANTLGLGDLGADVVGRGLSAIPGIPLDVSLRMGMGNLLPGTGILLRSNQDRARDLLEIAGPAGKLAQNVLEGGTKLLQGEVLDAGKAVLPLALANVAKAGEIWSTGEFKDTKGRRVMDADAVDGLMKFMGFQPAEIARESSKIQIAQRGVQLAKNVEGEIADKIAHAMADNDPQAVTDARAELAQWNADNPDSQIKITSAQIVSRLKAIRATRSERFIKATPREMRAELTR